MANGKIIQLKELDDLSTPIYPVTKADAVYLQNGSLLTDYLRGFPQTTIGAANKPIYLNNGVLTAGNEVYSKQEIDNMNTYSQSAERWTGDYWVDGKKIYTKTCYGYVNSGDQQTLIPHGATNVDKIWLDVSNCFYDWDSASCRTPWLNGRASGSTTDFYCNNQNIVISCGHPAAYAYFTVRYTKK